MIPTPNELFAMFERGEIEREVLVALSEVPDFRERTPAPSAPRSESGLPRWSYRFVSAHHRHIIRGAAGGDPGLFSHCGRCVAGRV